MLNNITNFFNLIVGKRIKKELENSDLIAVGTKQSNIRGDYKPTAIKFEDLKNQLNPSSTASSIWANGFISTSCIAADITLPDNATFEYNGPLSICAGYTLTIPANTTLTVL